MAWSVSGTPSSGTRAYPGYMNWLVPATTWKLKGGLAPSKWMEGGMSVEGGKRGRKGNLG